MHKLGIVAIVLGGISLVLIYFGVSDYQLLAQIIAYQEQAMKDGGFNDYPSMLPVSMDSVLLRFVAAAAFGIASFVVYLMYRSDQKARKTTLNENI